MGVDVGDHLNSLLARAIAFVPPAKMTAQIQAWAGPIDTQTIAVRALLSVTMMAGDLLAWAPSSSGATAFDRLARNGQVPAEERPALDAMRRARSRIVRFEPRRASDAAGRHRVRDIATDEVFEVAHAVDPEGVAGITVLARLAPWEDHHLFVGYVQPLNKALLGVALRYSGPKGLISPHRCLEAVYKHAARNGWDHVPGLNPLLEDGEEEDDEEFPPELSDLEQLAVDWCAPGAVRTPEDISFVRSNSDVGSILEILSMAASAEAAGLEEIVAVLRAVLGLQLETVQARHELGTGRPSLDDIAARIEESIARGETPSSARGLFRAERGRLRVAAGGDPAQDRLIARIQALRAKTVEQGCTEAEAMAAAEKVGELLDRHGLSLGELEFDQQAATGASVETTRRRFAPIDQCVPGIALFFDCRAWSERRADDSIRHIFFGLAADVAAAQYLYALVELAFTNQTRAFQDEEAYRKAAGGQRRTLTNSFQTGLALGIALKLKAIKDARAAASHGSGGRDLVVAKAHIVDAEMDKLGLDLRPRAQRSTRRIARHAFDAGVVAGQEFEYAPGLT